MLIAGYGGPAAQPSQPGFPPPPGGQGYQPPPPHAPGGPGYQPPPPHAPGGQYPGAPPPPGQYNQGYPGGPGPVSGMQPAMQPPQQKKLDPDQMPSPVSDLLT